MALALSAFIAAVGALYLLRKLFRRHSTKASIHNLPGPEAASWFLGTSLIVESDRKLPLTIRRVGNLGVFLDPLGWQMLTMWADTYGSVFDIKAFFGVVTSHRPNCNY